MKIFTSNHIHKYSLGVEWKNTGHGPKQLILIIWKVPVEYKEQQRTDGETKESVCFGFSNKGQRMK